MSIFNNTWRAVTGKLPDYRVWGKSSLAIFATDKTIDYTRNDYDLYRSLYYNVSINGKATEYLGGAMFVSPIINTTVGFALGLGYSVSIEAEADDELEKAFNSWLRDNETIVYNTIKHGFRDGDSYFYVDEYGHIDELDPNTVTAVLDPMTGDVIGYNVVEKYDMSKVSEQRDERVIVKEYRTDSVRYTEYSASDYNSGNLKNGKMLYSKVYTTNGTITPEENQQFYQEELINRPLPIVHFAHEPEPRQIYGNSELLKLLIALRNYSAVLSNATKGVIYNSNPIPYMSGVKDSTQVARQSNNNESEDTNKVNWSPDSIIFLENPESKAGYIQAGSFMADAGKLLEYYFYLIVETSETPEFVFGTAVASSKASVSEQMPIVVQKATRNRNAIAKTLLELLAVYADRKARMSDPLFLKYKKELPDMTIVYPDLVDEDKAITLQTIQFLVEAGIMSDETALQILAGDKIDDVNTELTQAKKDSEAKAEMFNALPEQPNRLSQELDSNTDKSKNDKSSTTNNK